MAMKNNKAYYCGCDLGSATGKAAIIDADGNIVSYALTASTRSPEKTAEIVIDDALKQAKIEKSDIVSFVGTGYGREGVSWIGTNVSEIKCHAKGVFSINPTIRTVIDIGGQDSKVIAMNDKGKVTDFQMNEKCAAGTGRFFETMSRVLVCTIDEMTELGMGADKPCTISKQCGIFAESEVITLLNRGEDIHNIAAGLYDSVARRVLSMSGRVGVVENVAISGGCARSGALIKSLERVMGIKVYPAGDNPQIMGALGAALIARESSIG